MEKWGQFEVICDLGLPAIPYRRPALRQMGYRITGSRCGNWVVLQKTFCGAFPQGPRFRSRNFLKQYTPFCSIDFASEDKVRRTRDFSPFVFFERLFSLVFVPAILAQRCAGIEGCHALFEVRI
jgi:hypothetical protein